LIRRSRVALDEGFVVGNESTVDSGPLHGIGSVPAALQFTNNHVGGGENDPRLREAVLGHHVGHLTVVSGGIHHRVDLESVGLGLEGREGYTYAGPNTRNHESFFCRSLELLCRTLRCPTR